MDAAQEVPVVTLHYIITGIFRDFLNLHPLKARLKSTKSLNANSNETRWKSCNLSGTQATSQQASTTMNLAKSGKIFYFFHGSGKFK